MGQTKLVQIPNFSAPGAGLANIWATLVHTVVKVVLAAQWGLSRIVLVKRFAYHVHQDDLVVKIVWMNAPLVPAEDLRPTSQDYTTVLCVPKVNTNHNKA
jgi:hypothetical protein